MTHNEMAQRLSEKCSVTLEEANAALAAGEWNMLTATHLLEVEAFRRRQALEEAASGEAAVAFEAAPAAEAAVEQAREAEWTEAVNRVPDERRLSGRSHRGLGESLRRLAIWSEHHPFRARRAGELVLELPTPLLAVLLLAAAGVCVPRLAIGLLAGCRYSFEGA